MTMRPHLSCLFLVTAVSVTAIATRTLAAQEPDVSPIRRILESQPDFTADLSIRDPTGKAIGTGVIAIKGSGWRLEGALDGKHDDEVFLKPPGGSQLILDTKKKIYADDKENFGLGLLAPWIVLRELSREPDAKIEDLGTAEIDGRRLRKLSATLRGEWTMHYTVYVDPSLRDLAVRIELEKLVDGRKPRRVIYEINNVTFEVPDALFQLPPEYREVDYW